MHGARRFYPYCSSPTSSRSRTATNARRGSWRMRVFSRTMFAHFRFAVLTKPSTKRPLRCSTSFKTPRFSKSCSLNSGVLQLPIIFGRRSPSFFLIQCIQDYLGVNTHVPQLGESLEIEL